MADKKPHPMVRLIKDLKRLLKDDSWIEPRTRNHWENGRNPQDGTVEAMADALWKRIHVPDCECTAETVWTVIAGFDQSARPEEWQGKDGQALFRLYLTKLAARLTPGLAHSDLPQTGSVSVLGSTPSPTNSHTQLQAADNRFLGAERLFDFFWKPFYYPGPSQRPAVLWVWEGGHYFDFDAAEPLMRRFGYDTCQRVEFLKFDLNGRQLSRSRYQWDTHRTICVLGRRSLFKECDLIYDRRSGHLRRLPARFELPEVNEKTRRFMKKPLTTDSIEQFHHVRELDADGSIINKYKVQPESESKPRVDYALIQRLTSENPPFTVYEFSGPTSLGTRASVGKAVEHKFPGVSIPMHVRENATIEMLFRVSADVQRLADSDHGKNLPWEPSLTDLIRLYIDGDLVAEEKQGQLVFVRA